MGFGELYRRAAVYLFSGMLEKHLDSFRQMEPHMRNARMKILLKPWVCITFLSTAIALLASLAAMAAVVLLIPLEMHILVFTVISFPILSASLVFMGFYLYPVQKEKARKRSIDRNLPFAITHMAAVASSGIPTEFMFELLAEFKEYGEVSEEAKEVIRNIKTFGMSSVDAMKNVAERSPSDEFRELIMGIMSTVESGGDMVDYLRGVSERALFDYKIKREKYLKTLSTYADIYTVLLVAAPLMMLAMLATMSIIGGNIMNLSVDELIMVITWVVLPVMNTCYIAFIHLTYPGV